tara:strand:- start:215 stop:439 length:225 start_codon:yes stop_codon:yes gene_type:complete
VVLVVVLDILKVHQAREKLEKVDILLEISHNKDLTVVLIIILGQVMLVAVEEVLVLKVQLLVVQTLVLVVLVLM